MIKESLVLFLSLLLFLASCSFFTQQTTELPQPPAGVSTESVEGEEYTMCMEKCNSCEDSCKDSAYYAKAAKDENENMCASIVSTTLQQDCQQAILAAEAVSQLNKEKCLKLTDEPAQQTCLVHVAAEIAVQSNSSEKCADAADIVRCETIFYKNMAVSTSDSSYCTHIADPAQQATCQELVTTLSS